MNLPQAIARTQADQTIDVTMTVNGSQVTMSLPARVTLSDALRDHLGLTGTHVGCEHGICGMCTVLVDGEAARACLLFAVQLDGANITTVEGLGRPEELHPLQESFGRHHGLQCGFCTPGFLMSSYDLLKHHPDVDRQELPTELSGVLCRCTGYRNIVDAVDDVAKAHRGGIPEPGNCGQRTLIGRTTTGAGAGGSSDATKSPDAVDTMERPAQIVLPQGEPTVRIDVTCQLSAATTDVQRVFADVPLLARCLPGAELTGELGDNWYRGRTQVALGPVRLSFNGVAQVQEQAADRVVMTAQGRDASGGGAQARIVMTAQPLPEGTSLHAEAHLFLSGRVASFGRSLAGDVSRRMFEDFARAVDEAAAGREVLPQQKPARAVSLLLDVVLERLRARLARAARRFRKSR